ARKVLVDRWGVAITAYLAQIGDIKLACEDLSVVNDNPFFCAEPGRIEELEAFLTQLRRDGDSVGARINVMATGVPVGWGEPVYDRLDAEIAKALMSINAVKGVEIGDGFDVVAMRGSTHRDEMNSDGFASNHSGGVQGGIS